MWTDISQFDIPEHLKSTAYGLDHAGRFTEIGEVSVVNSMFGKAKVRVIHPRKKRSLVWPLVTLAATGVAVAVWLQQDMQKPPEPMRIIVRSVANEGTAQTNLETLQSTTTIVSKASTLAAPLKSQTSPGQVTKAAVAEKPVTIQPGLPTISESAKTIPAAKTLAPVNPQTTPLASGGAQSVNPAVVQQTARPPTTNQPRAKPIAVKAAEPANQKVPPIEQLPENTTQPVAPASSGTAPDQGGTQP